MLYSLLSLVVNTLNQLRLPSQQTGQEYYKTKLSAVKLVEIIG